MLAFTNFGLYSLSVALGGVLVAAYGAGIVIMGGGLIFFLAIVPTYLVRELRQM
ncbi:MAG: hypothetical protein ABI068_18030 [Ktedonobacterales bacterium]